MLLVPAYFKRFFSQVLHFYKLLQQYEDDTLQAGDNNDDEDDDDNTQFTTY